jgi:hypothetical protein
MKLILRKVYLKPLRPLQELKVKKPWIRCSCK